MNRKSKLIEVFKLNELLLPIFSITKSIITKKPHRFTYEVFIV